MINVYNSLRGNDDEIIKGRTMLYIRDDDVGDKGEIVSYAAGPAVTMECAGTMFIVDDWLIDQLHKVRLYYGRLVVKDGEELEPPIKSDLDLQEEELERQLAELRRRRQEQESAPEETPEIDNLPAEIHEHDEIINDDQRKSPDT